MTTLVVTDLDGTVWDRNLLAHPDTHAALTGLQQRDDVELLVATGRRRNSARRAYKHNGFVVPSVLLNGAIGYDFDADWIFHQQTFGQIALGHVIEQLQHHELAPVAYLSDTRALAIEGVTTSVGHLDSLGDDLVWATWDELARRDDVLGMCMLGIEAGQAQPIVPRLHEMAGVEITHYADHLFPPYSVMLAPDGINKVAGINAYLNYANLAPERIVALGDAGNDLEMLAMADVAIAVQGGDQRALDLADHVIDRPERGGWATVLDHL